MLEVEELVLVEAFVAELAVEALDLAVLDRLARGDKAMLDLPVMSPALQSQAGRLGPVAVEQAAGPAPQIGHAIEHPSHTRSGLKGVGHDPQAFSGVIVMHRQQPRGASVDHPVMDEVAAPALIRLAGRGRPLETAVKPLLAAPAHLQVLGPVKPVDSLVVVSEAVPA